MEEDNADKILYILCFTFSIVIVFITTCLIIIYAKTKSLHSYPCYFNILLSSVISLDNIVRLLKVIDDEDELNPNNSLECKFQGFSLALFDKLMLTTMTIFSIISYLGVAKTEFYNHHEKCIFIILTIVGFMISLILAILFMLNGVVSNKDICYVKSSADDGELKINKQLIDAIVTSILLVINFYCIFQSLRYIYKIIKETKNNKGYYYFHLCKYIIIFILNNITFIVVILIILDKFFDNSVLTSLCYIILSLFIVLFYTVNKRVLLEGKKIICCTKDKEKEKEKNIKDEGIEISTMTSDSFDQEEEE